MRIFTVVLVFCLSTIVPAKTVFAETANAGSAGDPIVIRFSHVVAENTAKGMGAQLFKARVEERLGGRVRVDIYPRSQKFTDTEVVMGLLFGDVEMAAPSFAKLTPYNEDLLVFDLPFLFPDTDAVHRFQESEVGRKLLDSMLPIGIRGLAYWDNGMRVISSNKPLRKPTDIDGLTFRIEPSRIFQEQYTNLGVVPRPMPFSRLTDAIRVGLVNGQENTWSNIHSRDVHRYQKYFTELDHSFLGYMVIVSDAFWKSLPTDIRDEIERILAEVTAEERALAAEQAVAFRRKVMASEGVEVVRPTSDEVEEWRVAMCPVWTPFAADRIEPEVLAAAMAASASVMHTASGPGQATPGTHAASSGFGAACQSMTP